MISAQMDSMAQEALIEKYMFLPNQVSFFKQNFFLRQSLFPKIDYLVLLELVGYISVQFE